MPEFVFKLENLVATLTEKGCKVSGTAFIYDEFEDTRCPLCGEVVSKGVAHSCTKGSPAAPARRRRAVRR